MTLKLIQPRPFHQCRLSLLKPAAVAAVLTSSLTSEAHAFAQVFTTKGKALMDNLLLIGKTGVGIALVVAAIGALTGRGVNWKLLGTIIGVGFALVGFPTLYQYFIS